MVVRNSRFLPVLRGDERTQLRMHSPNGPVSPCGIESEMVYNVSSVMWTTENFVQFLGFILHN